VARSNFGSEWLKRLKPGLLLFSPATKTLRLGRALSYSSTDRPTLKGLLSAYESGGTTATIQAVFTFVRSQETTNFFLLPPMANVISSRDEMHAVILKRVTSSVRYSRARARAYLGRSLRDSAGAARFLGNGRRARIDGINYPFINCARNSRAARTNRASLGRAHRVCIIM